MTITDGAQVQLTEPKSGTWSVTQVKTGSRLIPIGKKSIDWTSGPITIEGCPDTRTFDIDLNIEANGIKSGKFSGNAKSGVNLDIAYETISGSTRIYVKNGEEVWTCLDLHVTFDGKFQGDYKILCV